MYVSKIISALRTAGAEKAQCQYFETTLQEISVQNNNATLLRTTFNTSANLQAIVAGRRGTLTVNQLDDKSIEQAANTLLQMAIAAPVDDAHDIAAREEGDSSFYRGCVRLDLDKLLFRLNELLENLCQNYPQIVLIGHCSAEQKKMQMQNTNEVFFELQECNYSFSFVFTAKEGVNDSPLSSASSISYTLETPFIEQGGMKNIIENCIASVLPRKLNDKFLGDAVLTPDCVSDFISMYLGTYLSDYPLISNICKLKIGDKIASDNLSILSNPTDTKYCGYDITSDGYRAKDMSIIENGVLKNYCLSQYAARKTGNQRSDNIGDLAFIPAGQSENIIQDVKKGILMGGFSGGNPTENGDFSGVCKNCFYIEDGIIQYAIQEIMISGNLSEFFNNVKAVSKAVTNFGWLSQPWICVENVNISGN